MNDYDPVIRPLHRTLAMYTHERGAGVSPEALQLSPAGFKSMVNPTRADPLNRCCRFQCLTRQRTN